jgi:hypothetical protein
VQPRINKLLARATRGFQHGGTKGLLAAIDPGGGLTTAWTSLTTVLTIAWRVLKVGYAIVHPFLPLVTLLGTGLGLLTRQTWLMVPAMSAIALWYTITRGNLIRLIVVKKAKIALDKLEYVYVWLGVRALQAYELWVLRAEYATLLATKAQWLLNIAMDANPIGLLIVGVAGLAVGLYLLARRFGGVRNAARDAYNWLKKPLWKWSDLNPWKGGFGLHVPGLAKGGTALTAGTAMVGENGPELLHLPKGATVSPLNRAAGSLNVSALADAIALALTRVQIGASDTIMDGRKVAETTFQWQSRLEARA